MIIVLKNVAVYAALVVLFAAVSVVIFGTVNKRSENGSSIKFSKSITMSDNTLTLADNGMELPETDVKAGRWGGRGILLTVDDNSATIEFDCASGTVSSRLKTDRNGDFTATGSLIRASFGPVRKDAMPQPQLARLEGKVTREQMDLKVTLTETQEIIGDYTLEYNKPGRVTRCY